MKTKIFIIVVLMSFIQTVSFTQEKRSVNLQEEEVPERYIVKKGDTLWDISNKFFKDPFMWTKVWGKNKFIKDPHLIYPGQTLTIRLPEKLVIEQPLKTETLLKPIKKPEPLFIPSTPRISEVKSEEPVVKPSFDISTDSREVISKLRNPRPVYTEKSFMRTGFITQRSEIPKKKVIKIEGETNNATKYDMIYIDTGSSDGLEKGDILAVLTVEDRVKHPDTDNDLGVVVRVKGIITVVSLDDDNAHCQITENFDPVAENDLVIPFQLRSGPIFDAWVKPDVFITGTILAINEPMLSIHLSDILYLDKGSEDGVLAGDRFAIYNRESMQNQTGHRELLGELEAVNVMPNETAVTVVSLKDKHVKIGDCVELTARCRLVE